MDDIYKIIEEYNSNRKRKILIVFNDMIADMLSNKKFNEIVPELLIRGRKLRISLVFRPQSYFDVPKNVAHMHENSKKFNITSEYFSFSNNKPPTG